MYPNWNLTDTTRQGSRVSCLAQTGFAAFVKGVQLISGSPFTETEQLSRLTSPSGILATSRQISIHVYYLKQNGQSAFAGFHQFSCSTATGIWKAIQWVPRGKQRLPHSRLNPSCCYLRDKIVAAHISCPRYWAVRYAKALRKPDESIE